jgi:hypothetical protein
MREYVEQFNNLVHRIFGDEARFDGAIGTEQRPGEIRIAFSEGGRHFKQPSRTPSGRPPRRITPPDVDGDEREPARGLGLNRGVNLWTHTPSFSRST